MIHVPGAEAMRSIDRVLLVEDNPGDARLFREMFNDYGAYDTEVVHVRSVRDAESYLSDQTVDVIVLELRLADAQGLGALRRAHEAAPSVPLVVLTSWDDERIAAQALQEGAQDYLLKSQVETRGLFRALWHAIEQKTMEELLFGEKERVEVTLNSIGDAVAGTDTSGKVTLLNAAAERMTGWSRQESIGRPFTDLIQIMEATGRKTISNPMEIVSGVAHTMSVRSHYILVERSGYEIPIEASVASIRDRQGQAAGAVFVFRDVSAAQAMALEMIHSAHHDSLTGLPNRVLLNDRVKQAISVAARTKGRVAMFFLDLDGFKHINDSLGHPVGDTLLRSVAERLVECVRSADTVSRQGGDEFVVLLSELDRLEDAAVLARRLLQSVAKVHALDQHDLHVSASIGVSVYPEDGLDADALIKNADTAMYQAKEHGRQSYRFFTPAMNVKAVQRQFIEENLRSALDRQEFAVHYQPKIDLKTGHWTGVEALIRWTHPIRGAIAPAQFIPVAEDCGLILPIGEWVLREACRQARIWIDAGVVLPTVAVNISAMEFRDDNFLERVFAILHETGLNPSALELELTESVLMKHVASTEAILTALKSEGIHLAVDDFGTGYSSLSYLGRFPIDTLKIDQSFVRQISGTPDRTSLVIAVISMGRSLDLRVVAEGVETQEELAFLQDHQCDEAQGNYFSGPVPSEQIAGLLARAREASPLPTG